MAGRSVSASQNERDIVVVEGCGINSGESFISISWKFNGENTPLVNGRYRARGIVLCQDKNYNYISSFFILSEPRVDPSGICRFKAIDSLIADRDFYLLSAFSTIRFKIAHFLSVFLLSSAGMPKTVAPSNTFLITNDFAPIVTLFPIFI